MIRVAPQHDDANDDNSNNNVDDAAGVVDAYEDVLIAPMYEHGYSHRLSRSGITLPLPFCCWHSITDDDCDAVPLFSISLASFAPTYNYQRERVRHHIVIALSFILPCVGMSVLYSVILLHSDELNLSNALTPVGICLFIFAVIVYRYAPIVMNYSVPSRYLAHRYARERCQSLHIVQRDAVLCCIAINSVHPFLAYFGVIYSSEQRLPLSCIASCQVQTHMQTRHCTLVIESTVPEQRDVTITFQPQTDAPENRKLKCLHDALQRHTHRTIPYKQTYVRNSDDG